MSKAILVFCYKAMSLCTQFSEPQLAVRNIMHTTKVVHVFAVWSTLHKFFWSVNFGWVRLRPIILNLPNSLKFPSTSVLCYAVVAYLWYSFRQIINETENLRVLPFSAKVPVSHPVYYITLPSLQNQLVRLGAFWDWTIACSRDKIGLK